MSEEEKNISIDMRKVSKMTRKDKKLTVKYRLWLKYYIESGNATESAIRAYGSKYATAKNIGYENVKKMDYNEFLELAGVSDGLLAKKIVEGINSDKIHSSHTEPDRIVPDMAVRHRYLETALKLKKRLTDAPNVLVVDKTLLLDAVPIEGEIVSTEETKSS